MIYLKKRATIVFCVNFSGPTGEALSCVLAGAGIWSTVIFSARSILKMLFNYKGK